MAEIELHMYFFIATATVCTIRIAWSPCNTHCGHVFGYQCMSVCLAAGGESLLLQPVVSQFQKLNQLAHQLGFDVLFDGLLCKLNQVPSMQVHCVHRRGGVV